MGAWWWQNPLDQPALIHILFSTSTLHVAGRALTTSVSTQDTSRASRHAIHCLNLAILSLQSIPSYGSKKVLEMTVLIISNLICAEVSIRTRFHFVSFLFGRVFLSVTHVSVLTDQE